MGKVCRKFLGLPSEKIKQEIERRKEKENVYFTASDGEIIKYNYKELANESVPLNVLQYRGGTNRTVQQPYQSNPHLSSSIVGDNYISNLVSIDDKNGHILSVGGGACIRCDYLISVNLPNVEFIDAGGLAWNTNLSSVNVKFVKKISGSAFYGCDNKNFISIDIPNVTEIGTYIFGECTYLRDIYLTGQTEPPTIQNTSFDRIPKLSAFWVKNETYKQYLTANYWQNISSHISSVTQPIVSFLSGETYDTLVKSEKLNYGMSAIVPSVIPSKEGYEFIGWQNNYNDVTQDTSCYAIWEDAKVSLTYDTGYEDETTSKLKFTATNGTVCEFDYKDVPQPLAYVNSSKVVQYPFTLCSDISDFNTVSEVNDEGNQISAIGARAFQSCNNLRTINVSKALSIDNFAFQYCNNLSTINCPEVTSIGSNSFRECNRLSAIDIQNAQTIELDAFNQCSSLTSIYIPNVTNLGSNVFAKCTNLISADCRNVDILKEKSFYNCYKLSTINCDNTLTIEKGVFQSDHEILSVNCQSVEILSVESFQYCEKLQYINCPNAKYIDDKVFNGCNQLSTVILSNMTEDKITTLGSTLTFGYKRAWPVSVYVPEELTSNLLTSDNWSGLIAINTIELVGV